jgi:tetratricopeptide (TPR) repeat protein
MSSMLPGNPDRNSGVAAVTARGRGFLVGVAVALALAVGVAYANGLGIGFYFDDEFLIPLNPAVKSLRNIPRYFIDTSTLTTIQENADLRPVLQITYALNYAISGLWPWSYHVLNMILHVVNALLVFVIVRDHLWWPESERGGTGQARIPAAAAALLFALAPLNSQSLVYLSARSALLCTTFFLAAFLAYLRRRWSLLGVFHGLALLTKAIAVTLPAVIVLHDFLYRDRARYPTIGTYVRGSRRLLVPVGLTALLDVACVVYRWAVAPPWEGRHEKAVTPVIWFVTQWSAYLEYARLFVWPNRLSIDHDFPVTWSLAEPRAWIALAVLTAWIGLALWQGRRHPLVAFATLWFFVTLAPESTFVPLAETINDHRPYIGSSLGLSVLLMWILWRFAGAFKQEARTVFVGACLLLCGAAFPVIWQRNWEWQDPVRLWETTTVTSPLNGRAWMNAGTALMGRGDFVGARRYFEHARQLAPRYSYVYMNLAVLELHDNHPAAAIEAVETAVRLTPNLAPPFVYQGWVLDRLGRVDEAVAAYRRALAIDPKNSGAAEALTRLTTQPASSAQKREEVGEQALQAAMMKLGLDLLYTRQNPGAAATQFRKVLALNSSHYGATYQLAASLDAGGKRDEARPEWEKVLRMAEGYNDGATAATARARLKR